MRTLWELRSNGAVVRATLLAAACTGAIVSGHPPAVPYAVAAYAVANAYAQARAATRASAPAGRRG
ncbi:hypothetical protein [Actinoplanes regularis]|uniref:hypothetical protein n=1 Tax=Actinoplanes regularis TaxID=52697 RepID=UPI0024A4E9E1|nr:hypothetical protein [Actinoplanes regularis]GLW30977.1 hypothetical protein Areg01_39170 [Actinoplanes regularis]